MSDNGSIATLNAKDGWCRAFTDCIKSLYGDNEDLIAKWFKRTGKRDEIFLATKFGFVKGSTTHEVNTSAAYCKEACDASLKRLGIDCIDLCESLNFWMFKILVLLVNVTHCQIY